ncbi:hypothetical protein D3C79_1092280 [compost metagenome]
MDFARFLDIAIHIGKERRQRVVGDISGEDVAAKGIFVDILQKGAVFRLRQKGIHQRRGIFFINIQ